MDIEKLIKRLKCPQIQSCPMDGEYLSCKVCQKDLRQEVITEFSTLQAENEKLWAELEQTRENNKKLIAAMMMIQKSENPERMHVVYEMDYSAAIDHQTERDIAVIVFDGLMREDLRLRGQKED